MERKKQKLTDVCTIQYGYAFDSKKFSDDSDNIALIRIRDVKSGVSNTYYAGEYDESYLVKPGEILVGMDGEFNIAKWKSAPALLNQRVCKISGKENIVEDYLQYYLSLELKNIERRTSFVTVKHLSAKELNALTLELHSYEEQEKIAIKLKLTESIIEKRKQQLFDLDNLIKSRFVEMFGTYPRNEKRWKIGKIRDIVSEVRYGSSRPAVDRGKYPYLRMNNITYLGELDLSDVKQINVPDNELPKCKVRRGDVLFNRTNSKELVGKTCVYNRDELMVLAGFVVRVRVNNDLAMPKFLSVYMNMDFTKRKLLGMCKAASGQANINAQELQDIGIYIPPIEKQNEFVQFCEQVDKLKVEIQNSLDESQKLFDSLMQKYFE